jgi:hypothetical protein
MSKQKLRRIDVVRTRDGWVAETRNGRTFATGDTKRAVVNDAATKARRGSRPTSVRIHGWDGVSRKNAPIRVRPTPPRAQAKEQRMAIDRDHLGQQLRDAGDHDKADKAERELPEKVDKDEHKGLLDKLGVDDSILDKIPGGLGDKKLKDIL